MEVINPGEEEERACRYCFGDDTEGPLISPCDCKGGQKYVHLDCLRRWQRMVLVSQSTHPAFQRDDERHQICNVCKGKYTCPPPTRADLMASFTGPEIAALIDEGCIISSRDVFSHMLEETRRTSVFFPSQSDHWIRGVYLITQCSRNPDQVEIPIRESQDALRRLVNNLGEDMEYTIGRRTFRLVSEGSLAGVPAEDRLTALRALRPPVRLVLASVEPSSISEDYIGAVNITSPLPLPLSNQKRSHVKRITDTVCARYPGAARVELAHFNGGPCNPSEIATCVVPGGGKRGWTVVPKLEEAIVLAHSRGARRHAAQGDFGGGQTVEIRNLRARTDLNGKRCLTLRFFEASGRWAVVVGETGECVRVKPENLAPTTDTTAPGELASYTGSHGRVFVFWGNAGWSRAQLLGEIARGSWGMCRAMAGDLTNNIGDRWNLLNAPIANRLAFAPVSEMSEDYVTNTSTPLSPGEQERVQEQHRHRRELEMESLAATANAAVALERETSLIPNPAEGEESGDDEEEGGRIGAEIAASLGAAAGKKK